MVSLPPSVRENTNSDKTTRRHEKDIVKFNRIIRWHIQKGFCVVPGSSINMTYQQIKDWMENYELWD